MFKLSVGLLAAALAITSASAQSTKGPADFKAVFQNHLKTSEEFTLKVAEAMPAENYSFKLTPEQMSFGEQMAHLSRALGFFVRPFTGDKPAMTKPASAGKADVIAYMKSSFEGALAQVAKLTTEQLEKTYESGPGQTQTGYDSLLKMLDHTTHHRASAEMYLRVKGITPPTYEF
jgi:uncharacterized damage-inducible protein DinB